MRSLVLFAVVLGLSGTTVAEAATVTFRDIATGLPQNVYDEDGVRVTGDGAIDQFVGLGARLEAARVTDGGTRHASGLSFTLIGGGAFDLVSFDLLPVANLYDLSGYDDVKVSGLRGGSEVASVSFESGSAPSTQTFGAPFVSLEEVIIQAVLPPSSLFTPGFCDPCGQFDIDNVTLRVAAAIPLPAAAPLLATALAGLFLFRRRSRQSTAA
jgi:hypothetical protein